VAFSTSFLLIVAIAAAIAGIVVAFPRFRVRRDRTVASVGRASGFPASLIVAAALVGIVVMAIGLILHLDDSRATEADAISAGTPKTASARPELLRHLERSPRDGRGWVLLARMDFEADRFADAAVAYERALAADVKVTRDPAIGCEYADALGMAQGGLLAGKPRELVMKALALSSTHPKALEMAGSAAFEAGEYAFAAHYWRQLMPQLAERSRERLELAAAIARAEEFVPATAARPDAVGLVR
jgi:cytochrome c-type biogenesis protein CcmH